MSRTLVSTGRAWLSGIDGFTGKQADTLCVLHFQVNAPDVIDSTHGGYTVATLPSGWRPAYYVRDLARTTAGPVGVDVGNSDGVVRLYYAGATVGKGSIVYGTLVYYTGDPR